MQYDIGLVWLRRDLRLSDHAALAAALARCRQVHLAFVFDRAILDPLLAEGCTADRRVEFIHAALAELDATLRAHGGALIAQHADARAAVPALAQALGAQAVFANRDIEPDAVVRDAAVAQALAAAGCAFHTFKDQTLFEKDEVLNRTGAPFAVFTPYRTAWLARLADADLAAHDCSALPQRLAPARAGAALPALEAMGFERTTLAQSKIMPGERGGAQTLADFAGRIDDYDRTRDFPGVRGVSYLSVHLRFGTVSVRQALRLAQPRAQAGVQGAITWRSELVWREFYQMILWHHPHVARGAWRPEYNALRFEQGLAADAHFEAWCQARTGYPLVDAAMAQINATGYMHNRLRMIASSFLIKDLGLHWQRGEHLFARRLIDFDLASNNGGWQWAASTGCDAAPYFRIFNPVTQSQRFDPEGRFIRRYLPQLGGFTNAEIHAPWLVPPDRQRAAGCVVGRDYPTPIVDHAAARAATLARYGAIKGRSS